MEKIRTVNEWLGVAGSMDPSEVRAATTGGIRTLVHLREAGQAPGVEEALRRVCEGRAHFLVIPLDDDELTLEEVDGILRSIDDLPKPVLLQCENETRSALLALMSVAVEEGLNGEQILGRAQEFGVDADAAPGLKEFVEKYANAHASVGHAAG